MGDDQAAGSTLSYTDDEFTILVEWPSARAGVRKAARGEQPSASIQDRSEKALNMAMGTMRAMAYRVAQTMETIEESVRPDEAEVGFGINLDAEAGALLAKASAGAQITVKLKWAIEQPQHATVLVTD